MLSKFSKFISFFFFETVSISKIMGLSSSEVINSCINSFTRINVWRYPSILTFDHYGKRKFNLHYLRQRNSPISRLLVYWSQLFWSYIVSPIELIFRWRHHLLLLPRWLICLSVRNVRNLQKFWTVHIWCTQTLYRASMSFLKSMLF